MRFPQAASKLVQIGVAMSLGIVSLPRPGKPHTSPHSRSRRALLLNFRTRCFLPLYIRRYFLQLLLVELLHCFLDRTDSKEQISISLLTVLRGDTGWLCSDQPPVFQHPHILSHRIGAHSSSLPNGFETGPALISTSVLAEKQVGIHSQLSRRQTEQEHFIWYWKIVFDSISL